MRVILVDDQELALLGLRDITDWNSMGFELIGCYTSPAAACKAVLEQKPDAVFTDVRMPEMSGIQLIETVQAAGLRPEFVLISSYRDFDAAKEAIRLGVSRYILKPFERDEVETTLEKLALRCRSEEATPIVDPSVPATYAFGSDYHKLATQVDAYGRCYFALSCHEFAPNAAGHGNYGRVSVRGYPAAWLMGLRSGEPSYPGEIGLSALFADFSDFAGMYASAEFSLKGRFRYSARKQIADIQRYLCEIMGEPISLDELAGRFFLSRARFCALFKECTGYSPIAFVQHVRLYAGRWYLLHTDMRIRDVSGTVGYPDTSYYARLFKREFSMTPEECRLRRDLL